jgi:hypothetical protein
MSALVACQAVTSRSLWPDAYRLAAKGVGERLGGSKSVIQHVFKYTPRAALRLSAAETLPSRCTLWTFRRAGRSARPAVADRHFPRGSRRSSCLAGLRLGQCWVLSAPNLCSIRSASAPLAIVFAHNGLAAARKPIALAAVLTLRALAPAQLPVRSRRGFRTSKRPRRRCADWTVRRRASKTKRAPSEGAPSRRKPILEPTLTPVACRLRRNAKSQPPA